jgi:parvulin-like peptidyl-prolyl isomerase
MRAQPWGFCGLALLATVAGAVGGAWAQAPGGAASKPPAVVNGQAISRADFEQALKQLPPSPVALTEERRRQRDADVLMLMIDDVVLSQYLNQCTRVEPAALEKCMAELAGELAKTGKSLKDHLAETGRTEVQLRMFLTQRLQWEQYIRQHVTEVDVQKYFAEYKDFFDGVEVRVSHIVVLLPPNVPAADRQKVVDHLNGVRAQIVAGQLDFAEAAKKYSQCPTAKDGGDLGFFPRKFAVDEAFAKAAFATPVGQVSQVVQSEFGLHLIKVTERKQEAAPAGSNDYNKIKDGVRELCIEDVRQDLLKQLRQSAKVEINLR